MKQAEKDEKNRADRERLKARLPELQQRRADLTSKVSAVSLESAMGDAAAVKAETAAKAEIAQIDGQIGTIDRAIERLDHEYQRDQPAREAEAREAAKELLGGHSLESLRLAEAFIESLRTAAEHAQSYEHHRLAVDGDFRKAQGSDGYGYSRPVCIEDMIFIALKEAGFGEFDREIRSASDVGMVAQNASALRAFAPDHPACKAAQERADAFIAEDATSRLAREGRWGFDSLRPGGRFLGAVVEKPHG